MHSGEMFQIACPGHLAKGGKSFYADGDDSFQVPPNTPLTYNFNIIDCQSDFGVLQANTKIFHDKIVGAREKEEEDQRKKIEAEQKRIADEEAAAKKSVEEKKADLKLSSKPAVIDMSKMRFIKSNLTGL